MSGYVYSGPGYEADVAAGLVPAVQSSDVSGVNTNSIRTELDDLYDLVEYNHDYDIQAMRYNAEEAQKNRDWQEMMSNTAHQREVADLVAAGLNPILSAKLGGASTPVGSSATGSNTNSGLIGNLFGTLMNSALTMYSKTMDYQMLMADLFNSQSLKAIDERIAAGYNAATLGAAATTAAASRDVAALQSNTQRYQVDTNTASNEKITTMNNQQSERNSKRQREGSDYASENATSAQKYSAQQNSEAQKYSADSRAVDNAISTGGSLLSALARLFIN